jgi:pimeloyl-ACP methyl ester carboxylesterase
MILVCGHFGAAGSGNRQRRTPRPRCCGGRRRSTWARRPGRCRPPTLFLERADAVAVDSESVRAAAQITPNSRYVELPGEDQLLFLGDPEPALGEIEEFLTGARSQADPDRTLSCVPQLRADS